MCIRIVQARIYLSAGTVSGGRNIMDRRGILGIFAVAALLFTGNAMSQEKKINAKQLAGHWTLVSVDNVRPDGSRVQGFGSNPKGVAVFEPNGRFSVSYVNSDLPKFASNNRDMGNPDENKAVVQGSLFYFGTYSVSSDGTLGLEIEGSSFPNWNHVNQKRMITSLTASEMKWTVPVASTGGTAEIAWKRVK
jgi:Lipocalin-like domain